MKYILTVLAAEGHRDRHRQTFYFCLDKILSLGTRRRAYRCSMTLLWRKNGFYKKLNWLPMREIFLLLI